MLDICEASREWGELLSPKICLFRGRMIDGVDNTFEVGSNESRIIELVV